MGAWPRREPACRDLERRVDCGKQLNLGDHDAIIVVMAESFERIQSTRPPLDTYAEYVLRVGFGMTHEPRSTNDDLAAAYGIDPDVLGALPEGRFTLVNFFRLRDRATDEAGVDEGRSGLEAMMRYASVSGPCLEAAGGRFLTQGIPAGILWGEDSTTWDVVVVAQYPTGDAFRSLLDDPRYRDAFADRRAAVEEQRVVLSVSIDA